MLSCFNCTNIFFYLYINLKYCYGTGSIGNDTFSKFVFDEVAFQMALLIFNINPANGSDCRFFWFSSNFPFLGLFQYSKAKLSFIFVSYIFWQIPIVGIPEDCLPTAFQFHLLNGNLFKKQKKILSLTHLMSNDLQWVLYRVDDG